MRRERALAVAAAVVVLVSTVVVVAVPGAVSPPDATDERPSPPGRLALEEMAISPGEVSGETATLSVTAYVTHRGGPSENVTVRFRAVDTETEFVEASRTVELDTVTGDREVAVEGRLDVAREGGYRIETVVYRNGSRATVGSREVRGVGSLTPEYARTPIEFHRFDRRVGSLPTVSYTIDRAADGVATLNVSAYLTNGGDTPAGDLQLTFVARQVDSNVVADRTSVRVGRLRQGRSATPSARLDVPTDYNYYLVALLRKDGVIVDVAQSGALLNPNATRADPAANESDGDDDEFRASDFEQSTEEPPERRRETTTVASGGQPGFGPTAAILALVALAFAARHRRRT